MKYLSRLPMLATFVLLTSACGDSGSPDNPPGEPASTATLSRVIEPGSLCPNGGVAIDIGIDSNGNGALDADEINETETVCHGTDGGDGLNSLAEFVPEVAGSNCELGGTRIDVGLDANQDGILQSGEISDTSYLCTLAEAVRPHLVSAKSLGNTRVLVSFTQKMGASAIDPVNYAIAHETVNAESAGLGVIAAEFVDATQTGVILTTLSQNELTYRVSVTNVFSDTGLAMAPSQISGGVILNPSSSTFAGSPPNLNTLTDSDGDGLFDHEEQRGWSVTIVRTGGEIEQRTVTSDPFEPDTDGDGLNDALEMNLKSDPRDRDSDDDQLNDAYEYNGLLTELLMQDTDGDGIADDLETNFFRTSPLQVDTDGDQIPDNEEVLLGSRNARVADLPQPSIEIISTDLQLDIRFEESNTSGTRDLEARSVSTTLVQSEEKTNSRTRTTANEVTAKITTGFTYGSGGETATVTAGFPKYQASVQAEAGYSHNWSSSWTEESTRSSQDEYTRSKDAETEASEESTVTRRVDGAAMRAAVKLGALGDIAFNISDLQITALVPDERNPGVFLPIATLVPENPDGDLSTTYTLGPLVGERGPIVFVNRDVFPSQVERLMRNPTGVIFKISNYNITDELGRNFAFTSQDIIDRTALISIDYGTRDSNGDGLGDGSELYRVATSLGTSAGDIVEQIALNEGLSEADVRANFGLAASDNDSLLTYNMQGRALGVKFHDMMQNILGFTHYDEDITATTSLTPKQQGTSYSTRTVNGIDHIVRIRQTCNNDVATCNEVPGSFRRWATLTPSGLLVGGELSFGDGEQAEMHDDSLLPGDSVTLAYVQDQDLDSIPSRLEVMHGCSDSEADSDGDGLSDRLEVFGAAKDADGFYINPADVWTIDVHGKGTYEGFSGCNSTDSDADGIEDALEYNYPDKVYDMDRAQIIDSNGSDTSIRVEEISTKDTTNKSSALLLNQAYREDLDNYYLIRNDTGERIQVTALDSFGQIRYDAAAATSIYGLILDHEPLGSDIPRTLYVAFRSDQWWNEQPDGSFLPLGRLDASNPDTDEDGISDYNELNGYQVDLFFARDVTSHCRDNETPDAPLNSVICTSDPLNPDSDGDSLPDGLEITLRADPSFDDGDDVIDLEPDGLIGREEARGWPVTVTWLDANQIVTTTCHGTDVFTTDCRVNELNKVSSSVDLYDTDGDGLGDRLERDLATHPRDTDSDNDGRTDFEEIYGYDKNNPAPTSIVTSSPTHYDTDGDMVSDGEELVLYQVGPIFQQDGSSVPVYETSTNPNGESDFDGLPDNKERAIGTDANKYDTDEDGLNDFSELKAGSDPLSAAQVCVEIYFKSVELSQEGTCDGINSGDGAEVSGLLWATGEKSIPLPVVLDKDLRLNNPETINVPIRQYALLDALNPVSFWTSALKECDDIAEGKSDGSITDNCKLPASFSDIRYDYTFQNYIDGQLEVAIPQFAEQVETGVKCKLQFTVAVKPVSDSTAQQPDMAGLNGFCGGNFEYIFGQ